MSRKYTAFDIETAKQIPGDFSDWRKHRSLGICCAATVAGDLGEPKGWHGVNADGQVNEFRGGQETLLCWLETQLGLPVAAVHNADRITEYPATLDTVVDSVITASLEADSWATPSRSQLNAHSNKPENLTILSPCRYSFSH